MDLYLAWSESRWAEVRDGKEVIEEVEILFPLRKLPTKRFGTVEEVKEWLAKQERTMAKRLALWYLARQSLASSILYLKLQAKGYGADVCKEVVASCDSYLSDDLFWRRVVEKELGKGHGPRWIAWKWKAKGLPEQVVREIATVEKQVEVIGRLRSKGIRYFLQRGFDLEVVRQVL